MDDISQLSNGIVGSWQQKLEHTTVTYVGYLAGKRCRASVGLRLSTLGLTYSIVQ